jgi:hypothetical protein
MSIGAITAVSPVIPSHGSPGGREHSAEETAGEAPRKHDHPRPDPKSAASHGGLPGPAAGQGVDTLA